MSPKQFIGGHVDVPFVPPGFGAYASVDRGGKNATYEYDNDHTVSILWTVDKVCPSVRVNDEI